jgi:molybdopterin molybdotransferase
MKQAVRVAEAQTLVLDCVEVGAVEKIALVDALHRVIAENVIAPRDIPPHNNSAMDGYAVQHRDVKGATRDKPAGLKVLQVLPAGLMPAHVVAPGTAIKIMTGAPMPHGADTVVQVEHTNASDTDVDIYRAPKVGSNLRQRGEDIHAGEGIVTQQTRLRPAELGVLASVGKSQVMVYQRPRVAILATGDEIADLDDPEPNSKIINSNSYTIAGQVLEAGGVPVLLGVARDTREDISQRLASGLQAEVLITSGGVSAGDFDYVRDCLDAAGFVTQFLTVAMRPGSPVTFGTVGQVPVFSLPGNPVASMVTFELLVRPALLKIQGYTECFRRPVQAALEDAVSKRQGVRTFLRGVLQQPKRLGEMPTVTTTGPQGSGILRSMSLANCLIDIPEEVERLQPGDTVQILPL